MSSLVKRVEEVVQLGQRVLRWSGWLRALATVLIALVVASLVDRSLRSSDLLVRLLTTSVLIAIVIYALSRWVVPAFRIALERVAVSRRIEDRFPQLRELLSTAVAFEIDGKHIAQNELISDVVQLAERKSAQLSFTDAIDRGPVWRSAFEFALATVALLTVAIFSPTNSLIAVQRLASPWSEIRYPTTHQLTWVKNPTILARGEPLELELIDASGSLPDEVLLDIRFAERPETIETREMRHRGDRVADRLSGLSQNIFYRARGGDDQEMAWTELRVVEPPRVSKLSLTIEPPAYTGRASSTTSRLATVREGSKIFLSAEVDQPVRSATLRGTPQPATSLVVSADGLTITTDPTRPWIAKTSGTFPLELATSDDLPMPSLARIELTVEADQPPVIAIRQPVDPIVCTARAKLPFFAMVKDDLAVATATLKVQRVDASEPQPIVRTLYRGEKIVAPEMAAAGSQTLELIDEIDLQSIPGLVPGNILAVQVSASDYRPQAAAEQTVRVQLVSDDELTSSVMERQSTVLSQLSEALKLAKQAREQTTAISLRLQEGSAFRAEDIELLNRAELNQRLAERLLADPAEGAEFLASKLADELAMNRLENTPLYERLSTLQSKLGALRDEELTTIRSQLTIALKATSGTSSDSKSAPTDSTNESRDSSCEPASNQPVQQAISEAAQAQDQLISSIESMLGNLEEWDSFSRLVRELSQIYDDQTKLHQELDLLRIRMLLSSRDELPADDRASARLIAHRQQQLGRSFEKWLSRTESLAERLASSDPTTSTLLSTVVQQATNSALGPVMRRVASETTSDRVQDAAALAKQARDELERLVRLLSGSSESSLKENLGALEQAAAALAAARSAVDEQLARHSEVVNQTDSDAQSAALATLAEEKQPVTESIATAAESLATAGSPAASELAREASNRMQAAREKGASATESLAEVRSASEQLAAASREIQREIRSSQQQLLQQQIARLEEIARQLLERQKQVNKQIAEIDSTREASERGQSQSALSDEMAATLRALVDHQRAMADELAIAAELLPAAMPMQVVANNLVQGMRQLATLAARGSTDKEVQSLGYEIEERLAQLLDALQSTALMPAPAQPMGEDPQEEKPTQQISAGEIKLLLAMQRSIVERTAAIEARRVDGELSDPDVAKLAELSAEQDQLATLVERLVDPSAAASPEDSNSGNESNPAVPSSSDSPPQALDPLEEELLKDLPLPGRAP